MSPATRPRDLPPTLGMTLVEGGAEFAVYAGHADSVEVCLFDADDVDGSSERRVPLTERTHGIWFGFLPGVVAGSALRPARRRTVAPGRGAALQPGQGPARPLRPGHRGRRRRGPPRSSPTGSTTASRVTTWCAARWTAPAPCRAASSSTRASTGATTRRRTPRSPTRVVYEAHVRSLTMQHPEVPEHLRGTYAGLCHPSVIAHLKALGATAVELLPVQAFTSEPEVVQRGLTNYWGYNTLGFFAPHAAYASTTDPQGALDEFKGMVRLLHAEGIEVILDVVYNHTAEQSGRTGASLSWRGLDNRAYYRLDERGQDIDVTGCGNTLDLRHAMVCRMVLDSLRYWVQRVPRRRLPVRPGRRARPRPERRLRPQPPVPRGPADRPGAVPGQAHRRAVGRRHPRLAHRPVPAALRRVERPVPRLGAHLLARRPQGAGRRPPPGPRGARARDPAWPGRRTCSAPATAARGVGELRRGARRLHHDRPDPLQRQAQRPQRRGQPRRQRQQPLVEPRRRGPGRPAPQTPDVEEVRRRSIRNLLAHDAAGHRGADAQRGRRVRPQPGRQQQPLLPGQRDLVVRLGSRGRGSRTCSPRPGS